MANHEPDLSHLARPNPPTLFEDDTDLMAIRLNTFERDMEQVGFQTVAPASLRGTYPYPPFVSAYASPQRQGCTAIELDQIGQSQPQLDYRAADDDNDTTANNGQNSHSIPAAPSKIGKRFSSGAVKILKAWFLSHAKNPYPKVGVVELLQKQTGLTRQQINTWLGNARRRSKFQFQRPDPSQASPEGTPPIKVPRRRPTPTPFADMNPMERWENSPPEHELLTAFAIENAVSGLSPASDDLHREPTARSQPMKSLRSSSSASSAVTSQGSSHSLSSAYSYNSRVSSNSIDRLKKAIKRRRRRIARQDGDAGSPLLPSYHMFQCTFCTETFKTKHNWRRHEKSMHLSLEQWECSPSGATCLNDESDYVCIYCGHVRPDEQHLASHNYEICQERSLEDRTFFRKDHLQQHLKLVHGAQFRKFPMEQWKFENEEIRSRCGFCNAILSSWTDRVDHVAEHFKEGKTMTDWRGEWGFDRNVLDMVENAMAPCKCPV